MRRALVAGLLALAVGTAGFGGQPLVANVESNDSGAGHVVATGDSLSTIADQYGVTVEQLTQANQLEDPDALTVGQVVRLPADVSARLATAPPASSATPSSTAPEAPGTSTDARAAAGEYVVRPGDTLGGIARALGVGARALAEANGLADPNRLLVGQRLTMPAGARQPSTGTATGQSTPSGSPTAPDAARPTASTSQSTAAQATATGDRPVAAPDEVAGLLDRLAEKYGVDATLVKAVAWPTTEGRPPARERVGLGGLQVTSATLEHVQQLVVKRTLDPASLDDNAEAGVAYLVQMLRWAGEEPKGLAAFIQGPGSVRANGVRPATEHQVGVVLAARDRLRASPGTSAAASPQWSQGPQTPSRPTSPTPSGGGQASAPAASAVTTPLQARVLAVARAVAGPEARIGIAGHDLVSDQRIAVASDQAFPSASIGKLALLVEAYRQSETGARPLTAERRKQLDDMIVASDNDAANRAIEELGLRTVNANLQALGLGATRLANPFGTTRPTSGTLNVTTPSDMVRLLELLAGDRLVSPTASREMRTLLARTQDASKLRRGLPAAARVAHKSGWFGDVAHDVGYVTHANTAYVLAVFTEGIADPEKANQTIAAITKTVHETWGPR